MWPGNIYIWKILLPGKSNSNTPNQNSRNPPGIMAFHSCYNYCSQTVKSSHVVTDFECPAITTNPKGTLNIKL